MENEIESDKKMIYNILSKVSIGTRIDYQVLLKKTERVTAELIGIDNSRHIILRIVTLPKDLDISDFKKGVLGVARILNEGASGLCIAFRTEVITQISYPSRLIFFTFPEQIQSRELRKSKRAESKIPAVLSASHSTLDETLDELNGQITDISQNGCRFEFDATDEPTIKKSIVLQVKRKNDVLNLEGIVKNHRKTASKCFLGIQFKEPGQGASLIFENY